MLSSCESPNNNTGLRLGATSSQVYWILSALTPIRETLLFSFPRNTKYLIEYMLLKKRERKKTHLEMTYFILIKAYLNASHNLAL